VSGGLVDLPHRVAFARVDATPVTSAAEAADDRD